MTHERRLAIDHLKGIVRELDRVIDQLYFATPAKDQEALSRIDTAMAELPRVQQSIRILVSKENQ